MSIHRDISITDYHSADFVSHSGLRDFEQKGPFAFMVRHVQHKRAWEPTGPQLVGQAFEDFLCDDFSGYAFKPEGMKLTTKDGKAWAKEQKEAGLSVLDNEWESGFQRMRDSIMELSLAKELLETSEQQVSLRMPCLQTPGTQSRPDFLRITGDRAPAYTDLKTTQSLDGFDRSAFRYGYHNQAGLCARHLDHEFITGTEYRLLVVEKSFPNRAQLFRFNGPLLMLGQRWCERQLEMLSDYYEADHWPRVIDDEVELQLPGWMEEGEAA